MQKQFSTSSLPKILSLRCDLINPDYVEVIKLDDLNISEVIDLNPDLIVYRNYDYEVEEFIDGNHITCRFPVYAVGKGELKADNFYRLVVIPNLRGNQDLISLYTSAYNSKDKLIRAYDSLAVQTYSNWEWVIVDDSWDEETTAIAKKLASIDPRVRYYSFSTKSRGCIGEAKYRASMLCSGVVCCEFDHDDILTRDCLELVMRAYREFPDCGFYYSDSVEYNFKDNFNYEYEQPFGLGYCQHYPSYYDGILYRPANVAPLTSKSIRHIVSVPNHIRAWRTDILRKIQYSRKMRIADDYELMVRTFLETKWCYIPKMLYIQSMGDGNSQDANKNRRDIQQRVYAVADFYKDQITRRLRDFYGVDDPFADRDYFEVLNWPIDKFSDALNETLRI